MTNVIEIYPGDNLPEKSEDQTSTEANEPAEVVETVASSILNPRAKIIEMEEHLENARLKARIAEIRRVIAPTLENVPNNNLRMYRAVIEDYSTEEIREKLLTSDKEEWKDKPGSFSVFCEEYEKRLGGK